MLWVRTAVFVMLQFYIPCLVKDPMVEVMMHQAYDAKHN